MTGIIHPRRVEELTKFDAYFDSKLKENYRRILSNDEMAPKAVRRKFNEDANQVVLVANYCELINAKIGGMACQIRGRFIDKDTYIVETVSVHELFTPSNSSEMFRYDVSEFETARLKLYAGMLIWTKAVLLNRDIEVLDSVGHNGQPLQNKLDTVYTRRFPVATIRESTSVGGHISVIISAMPLEPINRVRKNLIELKTRAYVQNHTFYLFVDKATARFGAIKDRRVISALLIAQRETTTWEYIKAGLKNANRNYASSKPEDEPRFDVEKTVHLMLKLDKCWEDFRIET